MKMAHSGTVVVIGGLVLDIQARPDGMDVMRGSSVPGTVAHVPGGVGRNIAEGLASLMPRDRPPVLLGVVGGDSSGNLLLEHCVQCGIRTEAIQQSKEVVTPTVVAVFDRQGEVAACVASVAAVEANITPALLKQQSRWIKSAELLVLDANLTAEAMQAAGEIAAKAGVPVFLEPVSVAKATRAVPSLGYLDYISPNTAELLALSQACRASTGRPPLPSLSLTSAHGAMARLKRLAPFANELLRAGTKNVVLTMGELGAALLMYCPNSNRQYIRAVHMPAKLCKVVSLSGAGDSLVAGMVAALVRGESSTTALAHGMAVASLTVCSSGNVASNMDKAVLQQLTARLLSAVTSTTLPVVIQSSL